MYEQWACTSYPKYFNTVFFQPQQRAAVHPSQSALDSEADSKLWGAGCLWQQRSGPPQQGVLCRRVHLPPRGVAGGRGRAVRHRVCEAVRGQGGGGLRRRHRDKVSGETRGEVNYGGSTSFINIRTSELSDLFRLFLIKHTYSLTSIYQVSLYYQKTCQKNLYVSTVSTYIYVKLVLIAAVFPVDDLSRLRSPSATDRLCLIRSLIVN